MRTLLITLLTILSLTAYSQEYTIEATYEPYHDSLYFHEVLNNYIRDYNVNIETMTIRFSILATQAEGYEIVFRESDILQFRNATLVPLPASHYAIRRYIKKQYLEHRP